MLIALLVSCFYSSSTGPYKYLDCHNSEIPIEADDDILGFTAADVVATMQSDLPSELLLTIDELGIGSDLTVAVHGFEADVSVVEYTNVEPGCEDLPARALAVPVQFTVELAEGDLVVSFTEEVMAESIDANGIYLLDSTATSWPMTVDPELYAEIATWAEAESGVGTEVETALWFGGPDSTWATTRLTVELFGYDGTNDLAAVVVDGDWSLD